MKTASRPGRQKRFDASSPVYALSVAKTFLGRLAEKASQGQAVYIAKGHRRFVLQAVPEIEPIPLRPPGYFAHCYDRAESAEANQMAKSSVIRPPHDLE